MTLLHIAIGLVNIEMQFIVLLDGEIEIENSMGEKKTFKAGDVFLVVDASGNGHRTKNINQQIRKSIFMPI